MAYQQQPNMQYSQYPQHMANPPAMDSQQPFPGHGQYHQQPHSGPPPPMHIIDTIVYNSRTNQPLYAYTVSKAPDSDLPESLISLRNVPTGVKIGTIRRGGSSTASTCWGICGCFSPKPDEDVMTIGVQGDRAVIKDLGLGKSSWAWKPTWAKHGSAEEWAFFEGSVFGENMVLRDAIANGAEILRVGSDGEIKFSDAAASLTEDMVGEVMLTLVSLRLSGDDEKQGWLWELLCW